MDGPLVVEVLNHSGDVVTRHKVTSRSATIGRGYGCDVIVDDPHVCAEHLRIEYASDGSIFVRDLDSVNGLEDLLTGQKTKALLVAPEARFRIGRTVLQVHPADRPVPPALPVQTAPLAYNRILGTVSRQVLSVSGAAAVLGLLVYMEWYKKVSAGVVLSGIAVNAAVILTWAGVWALGTRFVSPRFRMAEHITVAALIYAASGVVELIFEELAFATHENAIFTVASWLGVLAFVAVAIYSHARLCTNATPRSVFIGAATVSMAITAIFFLVDIGDQWEMNEHGQLDYAGTLKPPLYTPPNVRTIDQMISSLRPMKDRVDRDSAKAATIDEDVW